MSYNITSWKTKELSNLLIPLEVVKNLPYTDVEIDGIDIKADGLSECFEIVGKTAENNMIEITKIGTSGDSSGSTWQDFVKMLKESLGVLVAIQIWEGGDSLTKLTVNNGEVIEEPFEL